MSWLTLLLGLWLTAVGGASLPPRAIAKVGVLSRVIAVDQEYFLKISPRVPLLLHFPCPCTTVYADRRVTVAQVQAEQPEDVVLVTAPTAPLGTLTKVNILCAHDVRLSLALQVAPVAQVSPRVEFQWEPGALQAFAHTLQEALAAQRQTLLAGLQRRQQVESRLAQERQLQDYLRHSAGPFVAQPRRRSGRASAVVVHVDGQRQVGAWLALALRVQNRERTPRLLTAVELWRAGEVWGKAVPTKEAALQASAATSVAQVLAEAEQHELPWPHAAQATWRSQGAEHPLAVAFLQAVVAPGETVTGHVAFAVPGSGEVLPKLDLRIALADAAPAVCLRDVLAP